MKDLFRGYYKPSVEEFHQLWQNCIFSFDANILLHIYSYTPEGRERLFEILRQLNNRIWIPHQVAYEYQKNRLFVICEQLKAYDRIGEILGEHFHNLSTELLQDYRRHSLINTQQILNTVENTIIEVKSNLSLTKSQHPNYQDADPLRDVLTELLNGKVGKPYSEEELELIYQKAEKRFSYKKPPGYKDAKKPIPQNYGDVIIWFQLIDYAKLKQKPIIFVTDDNKEDWWFKYEGESLQPRPDLIQEIYSEVNVPDFQFYMYHSAQFINYAEDFLKLPGKPEVIEEARDIMLQSDTKVIKVQSSYLQSISYDPLKQILEVELQRGGKYQYMEVPPLIYTELMNAPSHGRYFNKNIKDVYPYRQLS